ncbi:hypothetical protein SND00_23815, partial [Escherichia coli]|nr:hypothetical protein [Escherichia coli]
RNRSHWSTSKTPSYTKSVSWQHHRIPVGEIETFGELLNSNPNAKLTFWKFWFLGSIPWERKTVTPASLWHHPGLVLIHAEGVETPQPELTEAV